MIPIHPFLFGLYPILALYAENTGIVPLEKVLIPSMLTLIVTGSILIVAQFLRRDPEKTALGITAFFIWFYSFGTVLGIYNRIVIGTLTLERYPRYLILLYIAVIIIVIIYIVRIRSDIRTLTRLLNTIAIVLIVITSAGILLSWGGEDPDMQGTSGTPNVPSEISCTPNTTIRRDVYYIILDSYARDDVLDRSYHFNNTAFLSNLTARGFLVTHGSVANYNLTRPSLASSLNLNYVGNPDNRADLQQMVEYNTLTLFFRKSGYRTIFLRSGYAMTDQSPYSDIILNDAILPAFDTRLLDVTPLRYPVNNRNRREAINGAFSHLSLVPEREEPTFTFAHIVAPHNPYLFSETGEWIPSSFRDEDYHRQMAYVNLRTLEVIDAILEQSEVPPIIVLQADHGPSGESGQENREVRMPILNAYYLPGGAGSGIPDTITPVNSFRLILNKYYGCELSHLEDRYYYDGAWYDNTPGATA